jgi:hypothetical protein
MVIRLAIDRAAILFTADPDPSLPLLWLESLREIPRDTLVELLRQVEKSFRPTQACPFPTPGHVHELYAEKMAFAAYDAWEKATAAITRSYHPITGWTDSLGDPCDSPLPELTETAIAGVGGVRQIFNADAQALRYIKKEFIELYRNLHART